MTDNDSDEMANRVFKIVIRLIAIAFLIGTVLGIFIKTLLNFLWRFF